MKAACLFLALVVAALGQEVERPKVPSATTLNSPTSQIKAWYLYAVYCEQQIEALKGSPMPPDIQAQLTAIATRVTVIVPGKDLVVSWDDNSTNELGFKVERSTDKGATWQVKGEVGANVTSWIDRGLAVGEYWYRVFAYDATRASGFSNIAAKALP